MTKKHQQNRDRRVGRLLSIVTAGLLSAFSASAQDVSAVELKPTRLSATIYLLEQQPPRAGNLAVSAGDDGLDKFSFSQRNSSHENFHRKDFAILSLMIPLKTEAPLIKHG